MGSDVVPTAKGKSCKKRTSELIHDTAYTFPEASSATPLVAPTSATLAGPPSPLYPPVPLPATVLIIPPGEITRTAETPSAK